MYHLITAVLANAAFQLREMSNDEILLMCDVATKVLHERVIHPNLAWQRMRLIMPSMNKLLVLAAPKCHGDPSELIPTINLTHIHCHNETWCSATFITTADVTKVDPVRQFILKGAP